MKSIILNASFAFFIGISGVAHAGVGENARRAPQVVVSYSDLDLSRESGARVMLQRLESAASTVCGGFPDLHFLDQLMSYRSCVRKAMNGALTQLDSQRVSDLYGHHAERLALQH